MEKPLGFNGWFVIILISAFLLGIAIVRLYEGRFLKKNTGTQKHLYNNVSPPVLGCGDKIEAPEGNCNKIYSKDICNSSFGWTPRVGPYYITNNDPSYYVGFPDGNECEWKNKDIIPGKNAPKPRCLMKMSKSCYTGWGFLNPTEVDSSGMKVCLKGYRRDLYPYGSLEECKKENRIQ